MQHSKPAHPEGAQKPRALLYCLESAAANADVRVQLTELGWQVIDLTAAQASALALSAQTQQDVLIVEDSRQHSALMFLREQLFHPLALMMPCLVLSNSQEAGDRACLAGLGETRLLARPFQRGELETALKELFEHWSQGYLAEFRQLSWPLVKGDSGEGLLQLQSLLKSEHEAPLARIILALHYRQQDDFKAAEELLAVSLQTDPPRLDLALVLLDLYLFAAEPYKALHLIQRLRDQWHQPAFLCIDAMQALIMLNRPTECIPYLREMQERGYFSELATSYLPRVLYAAAEMEQFDEAIAYAVSSFESYHQIWRLFSDEAAQRHRQFYAEQVQASSGAKGDRVGAQSFAVKQLGPLSKPLFQALAKSS